jgi:hypothetical protein
LNVSNIKESGEIATSNNFKAGFQAGVVADFGITENFSIIPELLFSQRGAKAKNSDLEGTGFSGASTTLNYLQLPINAAYKFDVGNGSKLFVFAGPYLGYGISASSKVEGGEQGLSADMKFGSNEMLKAFDFGLNVGVGYQYDKVFFKLQYNQGLTNIYNTENITKFYNDYGIDINFNNSSGKNQNIAFSVGYFFN